MVNAIFYGEILNFAVNTTIRGWIICETTILSGKV